MKRWVKNLLCIIAIIAMLAAIDVTIFGTSAIALDNKVLVYEKDIPEGGGWAGSSNKGDINIPAVNNSQEISSNNQNEGAAEDSSVIKVSKKRLLVLAAECFILSIFAAYLFVSRMNKYKFKECFASAKTKLYYTILVIVLTVVLFIGFYIIFI